MVLIVAIRVAVNLPITTSIIWRHWPTITSSRVGKRWERVGTEMNSPCSACGDGDTEMKYHSHGLRGIATAQARLSTEKLYTLAEIGALAGEFISSPGIDNYERRLLLSVFISWLQKREEESHDAKT